MKPTHTITIDCGSSFIKGALFCGDEIIKSTQRQSPSTFGGNSLFEAVQLKQLLPLVEDLLIDLSAGITVFKLCISNEMHGFLLADREGNPCIDYVSWQKEYGREVIDGQSSVAILSEKNLKEDILHTGMPLRGGLPSCNLLWFKRKNYYSRIGKDGLHFYTLGDYIIRYLSGQEPLCHPTNAAATGLYDLTKETWNDTLIRLVGEPFLRFPQVGTKAMKFEWKHCKVVCLPAIGDQQAALLGAGVESESDLSFNLGTGGQVSRLMTDLRFSTTFQTRPYFYGKYLMSVPHLPSGRALNVYIRFFKDVLKAFGVEKSDADIWRVLLEEERRCESSDMQCDLSFFQTPLTDHTVGSIENIGEYALRTGSLMKTVIRQMGENFVTVANQVEPDKTKVGRVVFSGGVAQKIEALRAHILSYYPEKECVLAQEETWRGLNKYGAVMSDE